jgi:hypothetical protein
LRFGKAFEQGDFIAVVAIQQITIDIQNNLLEKLRNATIDDEVTDFTTLTDVSDLGRNEIKTALIQLYRRLYESTQIPDISTLTYPATIPVSIISPQFSSLRVKPQNVVKIASQEVHEAILEGSKKKQPPPPPPHTRKWSLARLRRNVESQSQHQQLTEHRSNSVGVNQDHGPVTWVSGPSRRRTIQAPNFRYEAGEDDPFQIWGNDSTESIAERVNDLSVQSQSAGRNIQVPTAENNFLGFCEGAWKLQYGDRNALMSTNWAQNSRSKDCYFVCTSCPYSCRMSEDQLWNKVVTQAHRGIKFRWAFLSKSHVPQKKRVTTFEYLYLCIFCTFMGSEVRPMGLEKLFEHVSSVHRGCKLDEFVSAGTKCISDRICQDVESFDINIWPLTTSEHSNFRKDSLMSFASDSFR